MQPVQSNFLFNQGPRTIFFALKMDVPPSCAVDQIIHILVTEPAQTLIKIDRAEEYLISSFTNSDHIKERVSIQVFIFFQLNQI